MPVHFLDCVAEMLWCSARAPHVSFPVTCCSVEWMNTENVTLKSFAVCGRFWFMMSWRATSGNYTCISPHNAGNSPPLALWALRLPRSLELTCAATTWKTIDQPEGRPLWRICIETWPLNVSATDRMWVLNLIKTFFLTGFICRL